MANVIEKTYEVATTHRVFNQKLDFEKCAIGMTRQPCKNFHAHGGIYTIRVQSDELVNSMVIDFNNLKTIKKSLDEYVDHRCMISRMDPLCDFLINKAYAEVFGSDRDLQMELIEDMSTEHDKVWRVKFPEGTDFENPLVQLLDSYTVVSFNSTSEHIARWMYHVVQKRLDQLKKDVPWLPKDLRCHSVSYKESSSSCATYSE